MTAEPPTEPARPAPRKCRGRRLRPGLLRREDAAVYCGVGESTWDRWTAAGLTPTPLRIGGAVLWSRRELTAWIDRGCPNRVTWTPIWQTHVTARRTGQAK